MVNVNKGELFGLCNFFNKYIYVCGCCVVSVNVYIYRVLFYI